MVDQKILDAVAKGFRRSDPAAQPRLTEVNKYELDQWKADRCHIADALGLSPYTTSSDRSQFYQACEGNR